MNTINWNSLVSYAGNLENFFDVMEIEHKIVLSPVFMNENFQTLIQLSVEALKIDLLNLDATAIERDFRLDYDMLQKRIGIYEDLLNFLRKGSEFCHEMRLDAMQTEQQPATPGVEDAPVPQI